MPIEIIVRPSLQARVETRTKRITREGDSIIAGEMTEYEELCEALTGVTEKAIKDEHAERVAEPDWFDKGFSKGYRDGIVHLASCLEETGHPRAAAAIREGIEMGRKPIGGGNMIVCGNSTKVTEFSDGTFEFSDKSVGERLFGPGAERFTFTNTMNEDETIKSPLPEELSAIKRKIGWDREKAERWLKIGRGEILFSDHEYHSMYEWGRKIMEAIGQKPGYSLEPLIQALLDHEDEE